MISAELRRRLESFLTLEDDWDSYGGLPIAESTVAHAVSLIEEVGGEPFAAPCGDGEIMLEWDNGRVGCSVDENGKMEGGGWVVRDNVVHEIGDVTVEKLKAALAEP